MSEPNNTFPFPGMENSEELDISAIFGGETSASDINPFDAPAVPAETPAAPQEQPRAESSNAAAESAAAPAPAPQPNSGELSAPQAQTQKPADRKSVV